MLVVITDVLDVIMGYLANLQQHSLLLAVVAVLALASLAFFLFFLPRSVTLKSKLSSFEKQIATLKGGKGADPTQIDIRDPRLKHLWLQYCGTLHQQQEILNQPTGNAGRRRATIPAEAIFNPQSVFESRIHTEFFKHLPGLLTGLGIIGTFVGLIEGLGSSVSNDGSLDTAKLIKSVKEAFQISAAAIGLAMLVTFIEKVVVTRLHRSVEQLCQGIDNLYSSGAGEEYLARLVSASEESASQARILKDALVGELSAILQRLSQQQIEASAQQQADLQRQLVTAIDQGLKQPLGEIAQSFGQLRSQQGEQLTQSLQDSMTAFADKLDRLLGGQVGQAKELQSQTLQALEMAILSFQSMAKQVGNAGESATSAMSDQLNSAIDQMATRQAQMNDTMRALVDEMRAAVSQAQGETSASVGRLLDDLAMQVAGVVSSLQMESAKANDAHKDRSTDLSSQAKETIDDLATVVRSQTTAVEQAALAMRSAIVELGSSVNRNVALMGTGAAEMRQAADRFSGSGNAISEVFDRSQAISLELSRAASALSTSSQDVQSVVSDYRTAREAFASIVDGLRGIVDTAKREVLMTSDLVSRLEAAASKLSAAQGQADEYLEKLNAVLVEAHTSFSSQMLETVRRTNGEFHEHLAKSTSLLASTIAELDGAIVEFSPRRRAAE